MTERLDKFIATQKCLPRSEVRRLIMRGCVKIDGKPAKKADTKIDPDAVEVTLFGEKVLYNKFVYIMLNKPAGVLSAATDKSRETVVDLVPPELYRKGLFPVGRLDKDTTGLLLITDDGDFAHYVISPKSGLDKRYSVVLDGEVTEEIVEAFKKGVTLADGTKCLPAVLTYDKDNPTRASVVIQEGKYHQIKRMFGVVDLGVNELHRESIGEVALDRQLKEGECRSLKAEELDKLYGAYNKNQH